MADDLQLAEFEMAEAALAARTRLRVALGWLRAADKAVGALDRQTHQREASDSEPVWGGPVDGWHRACRVLFSSL